MLIRVNLLKMDVLADPCASLGINSGRFPLLATVVFKNESPL